MARILLISSVGTHPVTKGNNYRVHQLMHLLMQLGHIVHLLFVPDERFDRSDVQGMQEAWGDKFHQFSPPTPGPSLRAAGHRSIVRRSFDAIVRFIKYKVAYRWVERLEGKSNRVMFAVRRFALIPVDAWYDERLTPEVRDLHARHSFHAVVVVYPTLTKAFFAFDSMVMRILDAQDCFSQRTADFVKRGFAEQALFPISRADESKSFRRADLILAIQQDDKHMFERMVNREVVCFGHVTAVAPARPEPTRPIILYVGSAYQMNVDGLRWFLDAIFPRIKQVIPEVDIWIAGGVGSLFPELPERVHKLGFVPSLDDVYSQAAVVINPVLAGSGLAIKSFEALAAGRPLVATHCGARGMHDAAQTAFIMTDDECEFANAIVMLLNDSQLREEFGARARRYALAQNEANTRRLADAIDRNLRGRIFSPTPEIHGGGI